MKQNNDSQGFISIDDTKGKKSEDMKDNVIGKHSAPADDKGNELQESALYKDYRGEISEMIKELYDHETHLELEEEKIVDCIKRALDNHDIKYTYDLDRPRLVEIGFGSENKILRMLIIVDGKKVIYRLSFPFRIQCNTLALVALFETQFNNNKAFSHMNLDLDDGEATMEYSFLLFNSDDFNEESFILYMLSLVKPAQEVYTRMSHLAVGKVPKDIKNMYKRLLEESIKVLNDEEIDEHEIMYGCEQLHNDMGKYETFDALLKELKKEDDSCEYDFRITEPSPDDKRGDANKDYPTLGDLIKMRKENEASSNTKSETENKSGILSMFEGDDT